jgi:hypothetical protein
VDNLANSKNWGKNFKPEKKKKPLIFYAFKGILNQKNSSQLVENSLAKGDCSKHLS